jgi:hypothetical protein
MSSKRTGWLTKNAIAMGAVIVCLLSLLLTGSAVAGNGVGIRYGWADVPDEVFEGSGDLGGTNLVGMHLRLGLIPLLNVEVAGEYTNSKFNFEDGLFDGIEAAGEGEYEDMSLLASVRMNVFSLIVLPLQLYVGGGLNVHWVELKFEDAPQLVTEGNLQGGKDGADDLEDAVESIAGESSEAGWHLLGGAELAFPGSGLSIFIEGRYMDGMDSDAPKSNSVYGGITIEL